MLGWRALMPANPCGCGAVKVRLPNQKPDLASHIAKARFESEAAVA